MPPKEQENQPIIRNAIKPGHWTGVLVEAQANLFDFSGELVSEPRDNQQRLLDLEASPFSLVTARPAVLAKGQKKSLEAIFFSPPSSRLQPEDAGVFNTANWNGNWLAPSPTRLSTWIYNQLRSPRRGVESQVTPEPLPHMPSFQYYLVVLARDPGRYRYLKVLTCINPPGEVAAVAEDAMYYRVLFPAPAAPLALPSQSLCWTSVSTIVWDDMPASLLTPDQQQAMIEWLNWGGNLVVSGPLSLDALRGTFLEEYLPAAASETTEYGAESLAELNANWSVLDNSGARSGCSRWRRCRA